MNKIIDNEDEELISTQSNKFIKIKRKSITPSVISKSSIFWSKKSLVENKEKKKFTNDKKRDKLSSIKLNGSNIQSKICDVCQKDVLNIKRHKFVHTGEKPFECSFDFCNYKTSQKSALKRHLVLIHKQ